MWRRQHRQASLWNIAGRPGDQLGLEAGRADATGRVSASNKSTLMTAEAVYDKIQAMMRSTKGWPRRWTRLHGPRRGHVGDMLEPQAAPASNRANSNSGRLVKAAAAGMPRQNAGPHHRTVSTARAKPPVDLPALLERFLITDRCFDDYDWTYPNRKLPGTRAVPAEPARRGHRAAIGVFVDTSGSVSTQELEYFAGCLNAAADAGQPKRTYVVYRRGDRQKGGVQECTPGQEIDFRPVGRGGTDFRPPFARAASRGWPLAAAIYLTDLEGPFPDREPDYPVLWVATSKAKPLGRRMSWWCLGGQALRQTDTIQEGGRSRWQQCRRCGA